MVGRLEITQALKRLAGAFGQPKDKAATLDAYLSTFGRFDCTPAELSEAVTRVIAKREAFFPGPAVIRNEIQAHRPAPPTGYDDTPAERGAFSAFVEAFERTTGEPFPRGDE